MPAGFASFMDRFGHGGSGEAPQFDNPLDRQANSATFMSMPGTDMPQASMMSMPGYPNGTALGQANSATFMSMPGTDMPQASMMSMPGPGNAEASGAGPAMFMSMPHQQTIGRDAAIVMDAGTTQTANPAKAALNQIVGGKAGR